MPVAIAAPFRSTQENSHVQHVPPFTLFVGDSIPDNQQRARATRLGRNHRRRHDGRQHQPSDNKTRRYKTNDDETQAKARNYDSTSQAPDINNI